MKGYKGFDRDLKCREFKYEIGKTFEENVKPKCCERGFHFCEYPLDVFNCYDPATSRFCEVEALGKVDKNDDNTKVSTNKIRIGAELSFEKLTKASIDFIYERVKKDNKKSAHKQEDESVASNTGYSSVASNTGYSSVASNTGYSSVASNTGDRSVASNTGYSSVASNTGYSSVASNTGDRSVASNTGYSSVASNTGKYGIASSLGIEGKAKGKKGTWLVLAEWEWLDNEYEYRVKEVKTVVVDGKTIKEDTLYKLVNGEFIEVTEE